MVWYGLEPLVPGSPGKAIEVAGKSAWPNLNAFTQRRAAVFEEGRNALLAYVAKATDPADFVRRGEQYLTALGSRMNLERPSSWKTFLERGIALKHDKVNTMVLRIEPDSGTRMPFRIGVTSWVTPIACLDCVPRRWKFWKLGGDGSVGPIAASPCCQIRNFANRLWLLSRTTSTRKRRKRWLRRYLTSPEIEKRRH